MVSAMTTYFSFCSFKKGKDAGQGFHTAVIDLHVLFRIGRNDIEASVFPHQIPLAARAQMVHKRMVILTHDNGDIVDPAVYHTG